jgi:hypothetical protein
MMRSNPSNGVGHLELNFRRLARGSQSAQNLANGEKIRGHMMVVEALDTDCYELAWEFERKGKLERKLEGLGKKNRGVRERQGYGLRLTVHDLIV